MHSHKNYYESVRKSRYFLTFVDLDIEINSKIDKYPYPQGKESNQANNSKETFANFVCNVYYKNEFTFKILHQIIFSSC